MLVFQMRVKSACLSDESEERLPFRLKNDCQMRVKSACLSDESEECLSFR